MLKQQFIYLEETLSTSNGWTNSGNAFTVGKLKGYFNCLERYGKVTLMDYDSDWNVIPFTGSVKEWLETEYRMYDYVDKESQALFHHRFNKVELNNRFYV